MNEDRENEYQTIEDHNSPFGNKPISDAAIVGYNMFALVIYTLLCRLTTRMDGIFLDGMLIFFHFIVCLFLSHELTRKIWLLSAALVLIIGFSTCRLM